ncbi:MAG: hypothetical protein HYX63_21005 [Gammaproteobacteria bacterium]|nr:hypothetical protein [Gammaproteobacteria bacterium]
MPLTLVAWIRRGIRSCALTVAALGTLTACKPPDLKPNFMRHDPPATEPSPATAPAAAVDPSLTPRELITARLINTRAPDSKTPGMTVGKLIEFADRYLACDCANTRFAKTWKRLDSGYELSTNSGQVRPLRLMCTGTGEATECYLNEIDRGAQIPRLQERFMPGSDFIEFIYQHGVNCPRTEPCPTPVVGNAAAAEH